MAVTRSVMVTSLPSSPAAARPGPVNDSAQQNAWARGPRWPGLSSAGLPDRWATSPTFRVGEARGHYQTTSSTPRARKSPPSTLEPGESSTCVLCGGRDRVALRRLHRLRVLHDRSGGFVPMRCLRPRRHGADAHARGAPRPLPARVRELLRAARTRSPGSCCAATSAARPTSAGGTSRPTAASSRSAAPPATSSPSSRASTPWCRASSSARRLRGRPRPRASTCSAGRSRSTRPTSSTTSCS